MVLIIVIYEAKFYGGEVTNIWSILKVTKHTVKLNLYNVIKLRCIKEFDL